MPVNRRVTATPPLRRPTCLRVEDFMSSDVLSVYVTKTVASDGDYNEAVILAGYLASDVKEDTNERNECRAEYLEC